jgi:uncharacterized RDD family membrane protein YckC
MSLKDRFGKDSKSSTESEKLSPLERYLAKQDRLKKQKELEEQKSAEDRAEKIQDKGLGKVVEKSENQNPEQGQSATDAGKSVQGLSQQPTRNAESSDTVLNASMAPGHFWPRFAATLVDSLIIQALNWPARNFVNGIVGFVLGSRVELLSGATAFISLNLVIFLYYGWSYSHKGASPGKILLELEVVDTHSGKNISYARAYFRETIGKFISGMPLALGFILAGLRSDRRALHDLIFDTRVIQKRT